MSTFTGWNGPECGGGGVRVDIAKLIDAYNQMSAGLVAKLDKTEAAATYRTIADSISRAEIAEALAGKASDSLAQLLRRKVEELESAGFVTKEQGDAYWAAFVTEGYAKNSDLAKYVLSTTASATYQTKEAMGEYQKTSEADAKYATKAESEDTYATKIYVDSTFARKEDVPNMEQFDDVADALTSEGDNAKLKGDALLDKGGNVIAQLADVPNGEGGTTKVLQVGDNTKSVAFPQRPVIMVPTEEGKYEFKYLVTNDEVGTVPVGGIIRWAINWEDCPEGTDLMEFLHLDGYNGEWYPCSGAVIPSDPEFNEVRNILNSSTFPKESYSIIHAKAAAATKSIPQDIWAMDTAILSETLRDKIIEAQRVIEKYNDMIAQQNSLLANKAESSYVDATFETKLDAAKHETISHARQTYATRAALTQEQVRATMMEDRLGNEIKAIPSDWTKKLNGKATWSALEGERSERRALDNDLQRQIIAEHIGTHAEQDRMRERMDDFDHRLDKEHRSHKSDIASLGGAVETTGQAIAQESIKRKAADDYLNKKINEAGTALMIEAEVRAEKDAEIESRLP